MSGKNLQLKTYHLQLFNVLVTVSDRKIAHDDYTSLALNVGTGNWDPSGSADGLTDYFTADVTSASDYYAGALMPGRNFSSNSYTYGFNGMEKDNEIYNSDGTAYTAQFWEYDARLGRRWNVDPVVKPWESAYATFSNDPLLRIDPKGSSDTKYVDEDGKELLNTDDGNNSTVTVKKDQMYKFNAFVEAGKKHNVLNSGGYNRWFINWVTPKTEPLYFTNQSYGLKYLEETSQHNKTEMSGFLEKSGGFIVAPREGYGSNGEYRKSTADVSFPSLLKVDGNGMTTIGGRTYRVTAMLHTHPVFSTGDSEHDKLRAQAGEFFSGMPGMSRSGDIQTFESFYRTTGITTFYVLTPTSVIGAYVTSDGRVNNIWRVGDKQPYLKGTQKLISY